MAKVFVSYSRKDIEFAKHLTSELQKSELDFWIDWEGIPPTVDWWKEIEKGIEEADVFLFLISPDSAKSNICGQEIDTAVKNGKRLIPLVVRDIQGNETPSQLRHLNWIFFRENDDFDTAVQKLLTAIHTDYEWAATHRRLQVKALEWQRKNRDNSFLLRDKDLQEAEFQTAVNSSKVPYPTNLQKEYILASRSMAEAQRRSARIFRNIIFTIGAILLITIALAVNGKFNRFIYRPVDMENYWVTIPAGEFQMGSENGGDDEKPVHTVYLDAYQIGKYEVTHRQYIQCTKAGFCIGNMFGEGRALHPVVNVTWNDANTFCRWIGGYLPTEAEWEKAARGPDGRIYPWGNKNPTPELANYFGNVGGTTPVGSYPEGISPYGLFDMAGNVSEWVNDWYSSSYYENSPSANPLGGDEGNIRVIRGGSGYVMNNDARSSHRDWSFPSFSDEYLGFRCARDISQTQDTVLTTTAFAQEYPLAATSNAQHYALSATASELTSTSTPNLEQALATVFMQADTSPTAPATIETNPPSKIPTPTP